MKTIKTILLVTVLFGNSLFSQMIENDLETGHIIDLAGPRLGMTYLTKNFLSNMDKDIDVGSVVSQFGYQFEKRFFTTNSGATALTEVILLVGGIEHDLVVPSVTAMIGMRTSNGFEVAAGPNITPSGSSVVVGLGLTYQSGGINFPVNLATSLSKRGTRISLLMGFNLRS